MVSFDPRLLTPPTEEEEVYPYRRAWRSIVVENGILLGIVGGVVIILSFLDIRLSAILITSISILLTLTPLILWLIFSYRVEQYSEHPRARLLGVVITSALVANAIGVPLVNDFFKVDEWLPLASAVNRIIGYTFTVGIVHEILKYLVVRYLVWPDHFRNRWDGVAYGAASAVGYAVVLNLHFVLATNPTPHIAAIRVFDTMAVQTVGSILVGYGLAELRFGYPTPLLPAITLGLAAFITGIALPFRAGLVNASLSQGVSAVSPIRALGFSAAVLIGMSLLLAFVFNTSERQAQEALANDEI